MADFYSVTELANDLGVTPRALRFYEDKGLIAPQRAGHTRVYTGRERGRLKLILRGKRLGFTLSEVREWLDLYELDTELVSRKDHLQSKLRGRIDALERQREDLDATLGELHEILDQVEHCLAGEPSRRPVTGG